MSWARSEMAAVSDRQIRGKNYPRVARPGGFALMCEPLLFACPNKSTQNKRHRPRRRLRRSTPMLTSTGRTKNSHRFRDAQTPLCAGAVRRTPVAAPRLRRLQQRTEYSAGDPVLGVEPEPAVGALWFGTTPHLPSRVCIRSPFRAGADVQVAWVSGAPRQRGQLSEHRQSDASSGRVPGNLYGCAYPRSGRICRGSFPLVTFVWTSKRK